MDFWAQHKDFVLKILAGFGVFLVALIARGIAFGDELEDASKENRKLSSEIKAMKIATPSEIRGLEGARDKLKVNARNISAQIAWVGTAEELEPKLIERALGYLRPNREDPQRLPAAVRLAQDAIRANLNGGFGELRGAIEDELVNEASEKNIRIERDLGFAQITELQPEELEKYLLQLELATRVVRYCIDAEVDAIEEIRVEQRGTTVIPGGNPEFLREYPVRIRFRASQAAMLKVFRALDNNKPTAPDRGVSIERTERPRDHVIVEATLLAIAVNLDAGFAAEAKE
ncbi:MAG: hypothetical protein ACYTGN_15070 [Planctomycetota bacterium]|jgi:hypothetical protein